MIVQIKDSEEGDYNRDTCVAVLYVLNILDNSIISHCTYYQVSSYNFLKLSDLNFNAYK